jgi:hypothetical protein
LIQKLEVRVDQVLAVDELGGLLAAYFGDDPKSEFAGAMFDSLGENPPGCFCRDDLLAASLLDVRFGPRAVRELCDGRFDEALRLVDYRRPIWKLDDATYEKVNSLLKHMKGVPGIGPTRASKLLARKRPELVPIRDSVIEAVLHLGNNPWWRDLAVVLADPSRRACIAEIKPANVEVSLLRVLDVGLWMLGSSSRNARRERLKLGMAGDPWRTTP